jgi:NAD(P)-dependent dehydrogenase (short-subunit alcohol dehydrogenase family)
MSAVSKVWFITGTSKGFGRIWAQAALERGDRVVATARNIDTLSELVEQYSDNVLALALDVTDKAAVDTAVATGFDHFGRLDVVVNNAGYGQFGAIEELTEQEARDQFETNLFGALWVTQAVLPKLREQGSGHILQVSSVGGVNAFPTIGIYNASKWALEAMSQALAGEVAGFGIHVTIVEPGGFATDWGGPSAAHATPIAEYDGMRNVLRQWFSERAGTPGDPEATGPAILAIVDADEPPLRFFLGRGPLEMTRAEYAARIAMWEQWDEVSLNAHGNLEPVA